MDVSKLEITSLIQTAGKYDLGAENTEGMNAYAFVARHIPLDREVFLKVYDSSPERSDIFEEPRFIVEATTGRDGSANLVQVLDAERLGENWILVAMEFVEGGSVLKAIENGPFPLMDSIEVGIGILHGVAQLHAVRLVHRDIKPANILLALRNDRYCPKLGDFGSVARLSSPDATVNASRHSALYVPPEGWADPSQYGVRSDIYQVGVILGEMVHGTLPYDDVDQYLDREAKRVIKQMGCSRLSDIDHCEACKIVNHAISRRASSRQLLTLVENQPYVPKSLMRIINKATAPNPEDRYQSSSEMIGDLEPLHFPNWRPLPDQERYEALGWHGWDWRIEPQCKRKQTTGYVVLRSRSGARNYRRWFNANSVSTASREVLERG